MRTKEEQKRYMQRYNQDPAVKLAKRNWMRLRRGEKPISVRQWRPAVPGREWSALR